MKDVRELNEKEVFFIYLRFLGISIPIALVNMATSMYGPQKVFDFWIGFLRRPMDWFEHLYINGKQVAAFFYHTDASVSATQASAATRIESVWRGNAQRREGIVKVTTDAAREPAAPRVGAQVRARMQVLEDTGARRLLRGLAKE